MSDDFYPSAPSEVLLFKIDEDNFRLEVQTDGDTVWLTQQQMSELFDKARTTITGHIQNIFDEGELKEDQVMKKVGNPDFSTKPTNYYNLDVIISVGYRVKSLRGTQFRIWATARLREYLIKGFTMDDKRLKEAGNNRYFEELLARIRDIRSSEKIFWRKVLDIFATSIDYDPVAETSQDFFAKVQNQLHWAAHGHTAAEVIHDRADANQPNMGVTNYSGNKLLKRDIEIAKNYLNEDELNLLNRIVTAYLELAEIQALNRVAMTMQDWIKRLRQFLSMTGRDILNHAGKISRDQALTKAHAEYEKYRLLELSGPSEAEKHFIESTEKELKALEAHRKKR